MKNKLWKNYPKVKSPKVKSEKLDDTNKENDNARKCSEVEFEIICDKLEKIIEEKQPFLSMDPSNILSFKELSAYIIEEFNNSNKDKPYVQLGSNLKYISTTALKEKLSKELSFEPFVTLFDKSLLDQTSTNIVRPIPKLLELFGSQYMSIGNIERSSVKESKYIQPLNLKIQVQTKKIMIMIHIFVSVVVNSAKHVKRGGQIH